MNIWITALSATLGAIVGDRVSQHATQFRVMVVAAWAGGAAWNSAFDGGGALSSTGCFLGAAVIAAAFMFRDLDRMVLAAVSGWAIARLGCALVGDHMGAFSRWGFRHNLGFYEMLWSTTIVVVFYLFRPRFFAWGTPLRWPHAPGQVSHPEPKR